MKDKIQHEVATILLNLQHSEIGLFSSYILNVLKMRIPLLFYIIFETMFLFDVFAFLPIHSDVRMKVSVQRQQEQKEHRNLSTKFDVRSSHSDHDHDIEHANKEHNMIIPIFPLRKKVKFPTETVQLTLWEERYKYLAQNVLNQQQRQDSLLCEYHTFGILYASHKPQIVRSGSETITPIVECGDIGVLCIVKEYSLFQDNVEILRETNFPKITKKKESYDDNDSDDCISVIKDVRDFNKIRLIGLGVKRFRVENILSRGFDGENLPFILVEASDMDDQLLDSNSAEYEEILKYKYMLEAKKDKFPAFADITKDYQLNYPHHWDRVTMGDDWRLLQLWSFSMLSQLESNCPAGQMLNMLSSTSLKERLQYINKMA